MGIYDGKQGFNGLKRTGACNIRQEQGLKHTGACNIRQEQTVTSLNFVQQCSISQEQQNVTSLDFVQQDPGCDPTSR
jgi:hypothetical protein